MAKQSTILVKSKSARGFRRAGHAFTHEGIEIDPSKLKKGELEAIRNEPNLIVFETEREETAAERKAREKAEAEAAAAEKAAAEKAAAEKAAAEKAAAEKAAAAGQGGAK